jgi:hypothetical protein
MLLAVQPLRLATRVVRLDISDFRFLFRHRLEATTSNAIVVTTKLETKKAAGNHGGITIPPAGFVAGSGGFESHK